MKPIFISIAQEHGIKWHILLPKTIKIVLISTEKDHFYTV